MSNKLTKAQEIVESIVNLVKETPLGKMGIEILLASNFKKHDIKIEKMWMPVTNLTDGSVSYVLFCHVFEDETHYYDLYFEFEKTDKKLYIFRDYELDETLETVEED